VYRREESCCSGLHARHRSTVRSNRQLTTSKCFSSQKLFPQVNSGHFSSRNVNRYDIFMSYCFVTQSWHRSFPVSLSSSIKCCCCTGDKIIQLFSCTLLSNCCTVFSCLVLCFASLIKLL